MTGFRIDVDIEGLVHRNWWHLPWRWRWLWLVPGVRKRIEAQAVRGMRDES